MNPARQEDQALALRPDVVVTVLEREAVLLDLSSKFFYSVNASGWAIVQLFERGAAPRQVHDHCSAWGAPATDEAAIARFVDALLADQLVTPTANGEVATDGIQLEGSWLPPTIEKHREPLQRIMVSAFDPSLPLAE